MGVGMCWVFHRWIVGCAVRNEGKRHKERQWRRQRLWLGRSLHSPPPCSNQRETLWRSQARPQQFHFPTTLTHMQTHNLSQTCWAFHSRGWNVSPLGLVFIASCPLFSVFFFNFLSISHLCCCPCPRLLSPWHTRWFDIANQCQTAKPYFPSAVLSSALSSIYLSLPSSPPFSSPPYYYSLICSGGLVAWLQDFHITSFSLPEDLLLLQLLSYGPFIFYDIF